MDIHTCIIASLFYVSIQIPDQRLDLCKHKPEDCDNIRGQIVISLTSRDRVGSSASGAVVDSRNINPLPMLPSDPNELPDGWVYCPLSLFGHGLLYSTEKSCMVYRVTLEIWITDQKSVVRFILTAHHSALIPAFISSTWCVAAQLGPQDSRYLWIIVFPAWSENRKYWGTYTLKQAEMVCKKNLAFCQQSLCLLCVITIQMKLAINHFKYLRKKLK